MMEPPPDGKDDYSPSVTLVPFDHPIPLLRGPLPAGPADDPSCGPYVLAFKDPKSFSSAYRFCKSKLVEQCEAGVRIGCSISASDKCRPPWWKAWFGGYNRIDFKERERCEEREMAACIEASKYKCIKFAEERCLGAFGNARIARREGKVRRKEVTKLISFVSCMGVSNRKLVLETILLDQLHPLIPFTFHHEVTNYRGSDLLHDDNA